MPLSQVRGNTRIKIYGRGNGDLSTRLGQGILSPVAFILICYDITELHRFVFTTEDKDATF
jgi:hypothetical protein